MGASAWKRLAVLVLDFLSLALVGKANAIFHEYRFSAATLSIWVFLFNPGLWTEFDYCGSWQRGLFPCFCGFIYIVYFFANFAGAYGARQKVAPLMMALGAC
ncbi:MAG: hypothetical protein K2X27_00270 [Candidatus Obscuribacterales bacterium]|nr:hypothetical protein [Candidatus Obscuribacterales bacterium]